MPVPNTGLGVEDAMAARDKNGYEENWIMQGTLRCKKCNDCYWIVNDRFDPNDFQGINR